MLIGTDLGMSDERVRQLEQPVTDEQFDWLEKRGLLDNSKTFEENQAEERFSSALDAAPR